MKILLVDDERPARQLIKRLINWNNTGFEIAYEAEDGAQAYELYQQHHPQLIITDLQMPVMDGLELLTAIRKLDKQQQFIVFSCHESFSYAKKIIQLGGIDYLLKDTLTPDILYSAIEAAHERIAPKRTIAPQASFPMDDASQACNQGLQALLNAPNAVNMENLLKQLPSPQDGFWVASIHAENSLSTQAHWFNAVQSLQKTASAVAHCVQEHALTLLVFQPAFMSSDWKPQVLHSFKTELEAAMGAVTIGVCDTCYQGSQLCDKLKEARHAVEYKIFLGKGKIHYFDPIMDMVYFVNRKQMITRLGNVRTALDAGDRETVTHEIQQLYQQTLSGIHQFHYLMYLNTQLIQLYLLTSQRHGECNAVDPLPELSALEDAQAMSAYVVQQFMSLPSFVIDQTRKHTRKVQDVINYIHAQYSQDISLELISLQFDVHKTHLARLFKLETGMSVNEFIRKFRIETAKSLLRENQYRINEIAYMVGFNNLQSFYNAFTHFEGVSPKIYRERS